jgi:membrane-associated phospholipid phosphatase
MMFSGSIQSTFWSLFTRLGEAQILLPTALLTMGLLVLRRPSRPLAVGWLAWLTLAVAVTTATKVAFIGWGIGSPELDFTGISGHAMFAAAVYPLLMGALLPRRQRSGAWAGILLGAVIAGAVGLSRVMVEAHSVSEVIAGLALGGLVSAVAMSRSPLLQAKIGPWAPALIGLWLAFTPAYAPASHSHQFVTRLALTLAGHEMPHTREELHRSRPVL